MSSSPALRSFAAVRSTTPRPMARTSARSVPPRQTWIAHERHDRLRPGRDADRQPVAYPSRGEPRTGGNVLATDHAAEDTRLRGTRVSRAAGTGGRSRRGITVGSSRTVAPRHAPLREHALRPSVALPG